MVAKGFARDWSEKSTRASATLKLPMRTDRGGLAGFSGVGGAAFCDAGGVSLTRMSEKLKEWSAFTATRDWKPSTTISFTTHSFHDNNGSAFTYTRRQPTNGVVLSASRIAKFSRVTDAENGFILSRSTFTCRPSCAESRFSSCDRAIGGRTKNPIRVKRVAKIATKEIRRRTRERRFMPARWEGDWRSAILTRDARRRHSQPRQREVDSYRFE